MAGGGCGGSAVWPFVEHPLPAVGHPRQVAHDPTPGFAARGRPRDRVASRVGRLQSPLPLRRLDGIIWFGCCRCNSELRESSQSRSTLLRGDKEWFVER